MIAGGSLAGLFAATEEPFMQAVYDLSVPRMAFGRACLIGDAAFLTRPHAAASTTKAATNAAELARSIRSHGDDVAAALEEWEPAQLGNRLEALARSLGQRSQFGR